MGSSDLKIVSLNVRGILNPTKCNIIFNWLEDHTCDIVCLQETFCTKDNQDKIDKLWKGSSFHSYSLSSHKCGVAILFSKNFSPEVKNTYSDNIGRRLIVNFEHNQQTYSLVNIYAPAESNTRKQFFIENKSWIRTCILN